MVSASQLSHPIENKILAGLNEADYGQLLSQLVFVTLPQGEIIYEAESSIRYVYFPGTAVFSMLTTMEDGSTVEVGPVGKEGLVGLRVFLGAETTPDRVIVHVAGSAMRLSASVLKAELMANHSPLSRKLKRYTQMLLVMTGRSGACGKLHTLEQQLIRWLLLMNDYVGDDLRLTHELIALTLGVRRAGVTEALSSLGNRGVISHRRRLIHILDRKGLEAAACECYQAIKQEYDDLYSHLSNEK